MTNYEPHLAQDVRKTIDMISLTLYNGDSATMADFMKKYDNGLTECMTTDYDRDEVFSRLLMLRSAMPHAYDDIHAPHDWPTRVLLSIKIISMLLREWGAKY